MKIIIAPDSFKGSADAALVASAIKRGFSRIFPMADYLEIPVADGGEGTTDALLHATGGTAHTACVQDPFGREICVQFGMLPDGAAVVELAAASGLPLLAKDHLDPYHADSYGTGLLIKAALDAGCTSLIFGLGGSATNDGGMGLMRALGVRFLGQDGAVLTKIGDLAQLTSLDLSDMDPRLAKIKITLATDVRNPLCGAAGATAVYGPQKGVKPHMVRHLDGLLHRLADCIHTQFQLDLAEMPGIGAAGGAGLLLVAFCGATLESGIDVVLNAANIDAQLPHTDLVITGEGRMDSQSIYGKVPVGVAKRAKLHQIPVIAVVGGIGVGAEVVYDHGIDAVFPIVNAPMPLSQAMTEAESLIVQTAERIARTLQLAFPLPPAAPSAEK